MEEEWMRDRALLRDLLQKSPQASPRELAQATGRSLSWVKKWRKRLTRSVIPLTPSCCVPDHGRIMPPTSAGICGSASGLWRCAWLHQSI
jgi:hypothetical protein